MKSTFSTKLGLPSVSCHANVPSSTQNEVRREKKKRFGEKLPLWSRAFAMDQDCSLTDVEKKRPSTDAFTNDMSPYYRDVQHNNCEIPL